MLRFPTVAAVIWENTPYLIISGKLSDYPECVQQSDDLAKCVTPGAIWGEEIMT